MENKNIVNQVPIAAIAQAPAIIGNTIRIKLLLTDEEIVFTPELILPTPDESPHGMRTVLATSRERSGETYLIVCPIGLTEYTAVIFGWEQSPVAGEDFKGHVISDITPTSITIRADHIVVTVPEILSISRLSWRVPDIGTDWPLAWYSIKSHNGQYALLTKSHENTTGV